jgi:hypothetical protein
MLARGRYTNKSLAPTSIPAASGCKMGNPHTISLTSSPVTPPNCGSDAQGANQKRTPNRYRRQSRRASSHICTPTSDPRFTVGLAHRAPMSARAPALKLIGNDSNCHFAGAFASKTSLPPANVFRTRTSRIFSGAMENMSSLIRTMSANFPGVIEPFSLS